MSDLISRQAAIDAICSECSGRCIPCESYPCGEVEALMRLQSAEPEKIRCEDCKYKYVDGDNVKFNLCALNHNKVQSDDWYCADAEREEQ